MFWLIRDKIFLCLLPVILLLLFISPVQAAAGHLSSIDLIERAYRNGDIAYRDAVNYKVSAIFKNESLPAIYRSNGIIKSATPLLMEARLNKHLLSTENQRILARGRVATLTELYGSGVMLQSYVSPQGRFRIHFTSDNTYGDAVPATDSDGDGTPDYVEQFAAILDNVWTTEIEVLGYDAPPSDEAEGGDCLLDVYLANLPAYGYTQIDESDPASMVYMIFENDFSEFPPNTDPDGQIAGDMKVVAAHEFFHTIQFQITEDIATNGWWMEASATWMEDYVYPDVNDYINYIDYWFQNPDLPLNTYSTIHTLFPYGTSVWVKHMTEKFGSKFVYDVWKKIKDGAPNVSALQAITEALSERGTTLEEELKELRVANVTMTYEDAPLYTIWGSDINTSPDLNPIEVVYSDSRSDFSSTATYSVSLLRPLTARYYSFVAPSVSGHVNIDFDGNGNVAVMVIGFHPGELTYDITEIITDAQNNNGSLTVNGFSSNGPYSRIVIIPLNYSSSDSSTFIMSVSYTLIPPGSASSVYLEPNTSSLVTEVSGSVMVSGKQQYYVISMDGNGIQVLQDSISWGADSAAISIDENGLSVVSSAVSTATITAGVQGIQSTAGLSASNPVTMPAGSPRHITGSFTNGFNCPPFFTPIGARSVIEESNLNFTLNATDPEGDIITFDATDLPSGASFDTGTGVFNWTPNNIQSGTYDIIFMASDGSQSTSEEVTITVINKASSDSRCFIATAAFGSPFHPYVGLLREFRDAYMLTNPMGRWFVSVYYNNSPPIAEIIKDSSGLKAIVKIFLIPAIIISWAMVKLTLSEIIIIALVFVVACNGVRKPRLSR